MGAADLHARLTRGLDALGEDPDRHPCAQYLRYVALLEKWGRTYNLTGIREPERVISHHILDSLAVLPHLTGEHCLDIGSGAGLPGLILALARPAAHWTLLDSNRKKARFLDTAVRELETANVTVVCERAEAHSPGEPYTTVIARAVGPLAVLEKLARPLRAPDGVLLAMKGGHPEREFADLPAGTDSVTVHALQVPGVDTARSLVIVRGPAAR